MLTIEVPSYVNTKAVTAALENRAGITEDAKLEIEFDGRKFYILAGESVSFSERMQTQAIDLESGEIVLLDWNCCLG